MLSANAYAIREPEQKAVASFDDGAVLYDAGTGASLFVHHSHTRIVEALLQGRQTPGDLVRKLDLGDNSRIDHEQAIKSIHDLLDQLIKLDLIERIPAG